MAKVALSAAELADLERIAKSINDSLSVLSTEDITLELSGPEKLTLGRGSYLNPTYTKQGFIGGEHFVIDRAYVGKSGKVFVCFKEVREHLKSDMWVEVSLLSCQRTFVGFARYLGLLSDMDDDRTMQDAKNLAREKEEIELYNARLQSKSADPLFGSW